MYEVTSASPTLQLQETKASACAFTPQGVTNYSHNTSFQPGIQAGAIFVDDAAKKHICSLLRDPDWMSHAKFDDEDVEDSIRRGLSSFEVEKRSFGVKNELKLEVASSRLKHESTNLRIRRGELILEQGVIFTFSFSVKLIMWSFNTFRDTVSSFFDPCIDEIVAAVKRQIAGLNVKVSILSKMHPRT
jgi:hypothetical protein